MSSESVLQQTTPDHVRILTLNRPEKKNALSGELTRTLVAAIDDAGSDPAVRVVGITGNGDTFCAGADLSPGQERESPDETIERVVKLVTGIRVHCQTRDCRNQWPCNRRRIVARHVLRYAYRQQFGDVSSGLCTSRYFT